MNKVSLFLVIMFALLSTACGMERVEPGYVGIKVNLHGTERGVSDEHIVTGRVYYNPFTTSVYKFPTFTQRFAWTADEHEGSPNDESITFNSNEGASINVDVAFAAAFTEEAIPSLFTEFRRPAEAIVDGWVRDQVRNCLNEVGSTQKAVALLGEGKAVFIKNANECVTRELTPKGFVNIEVSVLNEARASANVRASIAQVIEATQKALQAEAEVRTARAEADKVAAAADGEKRKRIAEAQGAAEAITVQAKAQAEANRIIAESLSNELIQYETVRTWNGVLPRLTGSGAVPFVNVDPVE